MRNVPTSSGDFRISASIDKVKYAFVYLQRDKTNDMTADPYIFDTFKLNAGDNNSTLLNRRLEYGNDVFYPELNYESDSKSRIFSDLMNYSWKKNIANFTSLCPLIFFDLSYQAAQVSRDPKQLILKYRINTNDGDNFRVLAIVLYEKDVVIDKEGDQQVIV